MFRHLGFLKQTIIILFTVICYSAILLFSDYINVEMYNKAPRFRISTITRGDVTVYETFFYNAYKYKDDDEFYIDKHISME